MKKILVLIFVFLSVSCFAQEGRVILFVDNISSLNIDGEDKGSIDANKPITVPLSNGEHLLIIETNINGQKIQKTEIIEIVDGNQKVVKYKFLEGLTTKEEVQVKESSSEINNSSSVDISNTFTFYTLNGEKFYLILDGRRFNDNPETRVVINNLDDRRHTAKIIFQDHTLPELNEELKTASGGGIIIDRKYSIAKNKKGNYELNIVSTSFKEGTSPWVGALDGLNKGLNDVNNQLAESNRADCDKNNYGSVTVRNTSSNPYDLYIDGNYHDRFSGGSAKVVKVSGGTHTFRAVQVSGYMFTATVKQSQLNVIKCNNSHTYNFP